MDAGQPAAITPLSVYTASLKTVGSNDAFGLCNHTSVSAHKNSEQKTGRRFGGFGHEQTLSGMLAAQGFKRVDVELHDSTLLVILEHRLHGCHDLLVPGIQSTLFREHLRQSLAQLVADLPVPFFQ